MSSGEKSCLLGSDKLYLDKANWPCLPTGRLIFCQKWIITILLQTLAKSDLSI